MNEQWQRVLWKRQPYPDNYVPQSFLSDLRRNSTYPLSHYAKTDPQHLAANFHPYTYTTVVLASCIITQHIATLFIFIAVFARLHSGTLDPRLLVGVAILCHLLGYILWELIENRTRAARGENSEAISSFWGNHIDEKHRGQSDQIITPSVFGLDRAFSRAAYPHRCHVFRFDLGPGSVFIHPERPVG